ncbi:hypothetical protein C8J57DRAFT_1675526 [Mycena rebaudengoi]|nr:hypothetical protein C8J57DRAFT_1675526 [Mycena rebaudengoi]
MSETRDAADGEVLVRVDATNLPGYWSEIDTADPNSPIKRGIIEARWFGGLSDWISRLNRVESESSADLLMQRSFHEVLYSASQTCANDAGTAAFTASLDISVSGSASLHLRYGYYMEGTLFPPGINQAYVYASSDASAQLGFEMSGKATATYDSGRIHLIPEVSWPGLSYLGIVTLGPVFNIYGELEGSISVSGTFAVTNQYMFPGGRVAWGVIGDSAAPDEGVRSAAQVSPSGYTITPQYNIEIGGSLDLHIIPEAGLTVDIFRGTPAHLGVIGYISADADLGLKLAADLSSASVNVGLTLDFNGGSSRTPLIGPFNFFHTTWTIYDYTIPFTSQLQLKHQTENFSEITSSASWLEDTNTVSKRSILGDFKCPKPEEESPASECSAELEDDSADIDDPDDVIGEAERRDFNATSPFFPGEIRVATGLTITPPNYSKTGAIAYFDLLSPGNPFNLFLGDYGLVPQDWAAKNPDTGATSGKKTGYAKEHVYEAQLLTVFMQDILKPLANTPTLNDMSYCNWLKTFVFKDIFKVGVLADTLKSRLPHTNSDIDKMPFLNMIPNQAKAAFIVKGRRKFRNPSTLDKKRPGTILYLLRQAGLSINYMNERRVQKSFLHVANRVGPNVRKFIRVFIIEAQENLEAYTKQAGEFLDTAKEAFEKKVAGQPQLLLGAPLACSANQVAVTNAAVQNLQYPRLTLTYP